MLAHWDIEFKLVDAKVLNTDNPAKLEYSWSTQKATITLAIDRPRDEILQSIIHELVHICFRDFLVSCRTSLECINTDPTTFELANENANLEEERLVYHLSKIIFEQSQPPGGPYD